MNIINNRASENMPDRNQWCLGLPFSSKRSFSPQEIQSVTLALKKQKRAIALYVAIPLVCTLLLSFLFIANPDWMNKNIDVDLEWLVMPLTIALGAAVILGPPIWLLSFRDRVNLYRTLKRDLQIGDIHTFEGKVNFPSQIDSAQKRLIRQDLFAVGDNAAQSVDVLASGFLLRVNKQWPGSWIRVAVVETAAAPGNAYTVDLPRELLGIDPSSPDDYKRRRLTPSESEEIKKKISVLRRPSWAVIIASLAVLAAVLSFFFHRKQPPPAWFAEHYGSLAIWAVFFALSLHSYYRALQLSRGLMQDLSLGWLVIVKPAEQASHFDGTVQMEFLPASQSPWTVNGQPADWRCLPGKSARQ